MLGKFQEGNMAFRLTDILRFLSGPDKKKSVFQSEKEAYDFCRGLYKNSGGVTPELRRAFEFYQKNIDDGCDQEIRLAGNQNYAHID